MTPTRRTLLAGAVAALAGCTTTGDSADDTATPTPTSTDADTATPHHDHDDLVVDGVGVPVTVTIERESTGTVVYQRTFEERTVVEVLDLPPIQNHPVEYVVTVRWADGTTDTTTVEVAADGGLYPRSYLSVEAYQDGERHVGVVQS